MRAIRRSARRSCGCEPPIASNAATAASVCVRPFPFPTLETSGNGTARPDSSAAPLGAKPTVGNALERGAAVTRVKVDGTYAPQEVQKGPLPQERQHYLPAFGVRSPSRNCGAEPPISSQGAFEPTRMCYPIRAPGSSSRSPAGTPYAVAPRIRAGTGLPHVRQNVADQPVGFV